LLKVAEQSEQVKNRPFERRGGGIDGFSYFSIDFQLFYFLTKIIAEQLRGVFSL
jgi:hypothetical protein